MLELILYMFLINCTGNQSEICVENTRSCIDTIMFSSFDDKRKAKLIFEGCRIEKLGGLK